MTRPAELRGLPDQELIARLDSSKEELFNLRFQLATGQLDNPMRIKQVRHDVARILTVLREREIEIVDRLEVGPAEPAPSETEADEEAATPEEAS
ncbi:MAG: 50S ribosomal protein L29 [Actinomycetota bacterium]